MIASAAMLLLGGAKKALSGLLSVVTRYPWQFALCAALALAWVQYAGKQHVAARLEKARKAMAEMILAQEAAKEAQKRVNDDNEAKQAELARRADNAEESLDRMRTAADRFASRNSVRAVCGSASRAAPASSEDNTPGDSNRSGSDAVLLTRPEYDIFVSNTLRLEKVRQWGDSLIIEGLAIPVEEFGQ